MSCCGSLGGVFLCSYIVEVHAQRADETAVIVVDRQIGPRPVGKQDEGSRSAAGDHRGKNKGTVVNKEPNSPLTYMGQRKVEADTPEQALPYSTGVENITFNRNKPRAGPDTLKYLYFK